MPKPPTPGPTNSTCRTSNISATATSRCSRKVFKPRGDGAVPGAGRSARRRLVHGRPQHRQAPPRVAGGPRRMSWCRSTGASGSEGAYPKALDRHQLRDPLGQGARQGAEDPARPRRHLRPVERRPSRDARRDAAARSALHRRSRCRPARPRRRHREVRRDVVAGDQPARPLSLRQAAGRAAQSAAGLAAGHHRPPPSVLGQRSEHDPRATRC